MRRLLYLMHVDWSWIKQRPHFLAVELAARFQIHVGYLRHYRKRNLVSNERDQRIAYSPIFRIPARLTEIREVARLNQVLLSRQVRALLRHSKSRYVWVASPIFYPPLASWLGSRRLIYDCMDDCAGFGTEQARARAVQAERSLLARADLVFVSSARLRDVVAARGYGGMPVIVNNAVAPEFLIKTICPRQRSASEPFILLYFGTIGQWFDFDSMLSILDAFPNVHLRLAGPLEVVLPRHPRIEYLGTVAHHALPGLAAVSDVLVMPFLVNDLIKGVNPVKLYEYVCFGRNIIVPDYPEIRNFADFVLSYSSRAELHALMRSLLSNNQLRYSEVQAREFLRSQTWSCRGREVLEAIECVTHRETAGTPSYPDSLGGVQDAVD